MSTSVLEMARNLLQKQEVTYEEVGEFLMIMDRDSIALMDADGCYADGQYDVREHSRGALAMLLIAGHWLNDSQRAAALDSVLEYMFQYSGAWSTSVLEMARNLLQKQEVTAEAISDLFVLMNTDANALMDDSSKYGEREYNLGEITQLFFIGLFLNDSQRAALLTFVLDRMIRHSAWTTKASAAKKARDVSTVGRSAAKARVGRAIVEAAIAWATSDQLFQALKKATKKTAKKAGAKKTTKKTAKKATKKTAKKAGAKKAAKAGTAKKAT